MTKIRHYNAYISWLYRLIVLAVIPVTAVLLFFLLAGRGGEVMVMVYLLMLPVAFLFLFLYADRLIIGPVYGKGQMEENFLKTSDRGKQIFIDSMEMDMLLRLVIYGAVFLIGAVSLWLSGVHGPYMRKIWIAATVDIVALHAVTETGILIGRRIQNMNLYVLLLYGMILLLTPGFAAVVTGNWTLGLVIGGLYLAADVVMIWLNAKTVEKLTKQSWYGDIQDERSVVE